MAVETLAAESQRVMLGICADNAEAGVAALKAWVEGLRLPKGRLHGMDRDGVPLDMASFGSVYIKYNSAGGSTGGSIPGDAMLNGYAGAFRGVYFGPALPDGEFRQYAVLPLALFAPVAASPPRTAQPAGLSEAAVRDALAAVEPVLAALGAAVRVAAVDPAAGKVRRLTSVRTRAMRLACAADAGPGSWDTDRGFGRRASERSRERASKRGRERERGGGGVRGGEREERG